MSCFSSRLAVTLLALVVGTIPAAALRAAETAPKSGSRPRVGLVLSGGGARGAAHVGVLRVLEELRVPIDAIAGTSIGAIVGGLYAEGMSPDEIAQAISNVDWSDAFSDAPERADRSFRRKRDDESFVVKRRLGFDGRRLSLPPGYQEGQRLQLLLDAYTLRAAQIDDFDRLPIPFRAIATDIVSGEQVILSRGRLAAALRASMSIPAFFAPAAFEGRFLVDGGVVNNLPVDVVRAMGVDIVIAVDVSSPLLNREDVSSIYGVTVQLSSILTMSNVKAQKALLAPTDVLIEPELGTISTLSIDRALEAVAIGEAAARVHVEKLGHLSVDEATYEAILGRNRSLPTTPPIVDFVRAETDSRIGAGVIEARIRQEAGASLDVAALEDDVEAVYGLDVFERVSWRLERDAVGTGVGVVVDARRRSWGPGYVQFGLGLESDAEGHNSFKLGAAYTLTALNRLNGEWRTELQLGEDAHLRTQLHQPLDRRTRWFITPTAWIARDMRDFYDVRDERRAEYRLSEIGLALDVGRELATWGEIRAGIRRWSADGQVLIGDATLPQGDFDAGTAHVTFAYDRLDDIHFPHDGLLGEVEYAASRTGLGADDAFDRVSASLLAAASKGRNTFVGSIRVVDSFAGEVSFPQREQLGGFLNLSGFREDQLDGDDLGLVRLVYYRTLGRSRVMPTRAGLSLEAGNVWERAESPSLRKLIPAGSVFLGYDSPLGPLYLGVGLAEEGRAAFYLYLGRTL